MLQSSAPARELTTRMHVPSQPLMRSLLSQSLTPTAPRRVRRFFRVRASCESLHWTESPSLLRTGYCLLKPTLSAIDASNPKREGEKVNAEDWCKRRYFLQAPICAIPAKIAVLRGATDRKSCYPQPFPQQSCQIIEYRHQMNILTCQQSCLILSDKELNGTFCSLR
jgi:hypothetical protein